MMCGNVRGLFDPHCAYRVRQHEQMNQTFQYDLHVSMNFIGFFSNHR